MIAIFFRNLFRDLSQQPLRTILTLSGVVWGTFSVILLIAFGDSVSRAQFKRFHGMGQGIVLAFPARTTLSWKGFQKGKPVRVTPEMVEALARKVPGISLISPEFVQSRRIRYERNEFLNTVRGINPDFERMRNTIPLHGRFINPEDIAKRKRVCFVGNVLAKDLFQDQNAIGKTIFFEGVPFTVVGVMKKKSQNSNYNGQRDERCAFIPWTTFTALYGTKYVSNFIYRPLDLNANEDLTQRIKNHLSKLIGFSPKDPDAIFIWDTVEFEKSFTTFFLAFTIFLGVIGSFTLLVGGVGVASIMMIVVEERKREIGIKMAVGARRRTILIQFFSESITIMLMGGFIGFGLSALVIKAVQGMKQSDFAIFVGVPTLSPVVTISTILIILTIGTISGLIPARNAASTNPIKALRK